MIRRRLRRCAPIERGVVAVIVGLLMVVIVGSAATVFDLARLRHERHMIQAAVDLGSLAGAASCRCTDSTGASVAETVARAIAVTELTLALATGGLVIELRVRRLDPRDAPRLHRRLRTRSRVVDVGRMDGVSEAARRSTLSIRTAAICATASG